MQRDLAQRVPHQEKLAQDYEKAIEETRNKETIIHRLQITIK